MQDNVGINAGLVWNTLYAADGRLEFKALKKVTKLTDKELYMAFGWLLREGKLDVKEEGKDIFISLL